MGEPKLNIGLVGFGKHVKKCLLPSLLQIPSAQITDLSVRSSASADEFVKHYGNVFVHDSYQGLLNSGSQDALIVSVGPHLHPEILKSALLKKIPCFVEKPATFSKSIIDGLLDSCIENQSRVGIGYNFRFSQVFGKFREIVSENGDASSVDINFESDGPKTNKGIYANVLQALIYEMGTHVIDLMYELLGPLNYIDSTLEQHDDYASRIHARVANANGGSGSVRLSNALDKFNFTIVVRTTMGAVIELHNMHRITIKNDVTVSSIEGVYGIKPHYIYDWPLRRNGFEKNGYLSVLNDFLSNLHSPNSIGVLTRERAVQEILFKVNKNISSAY